MLVLAHSSCLVALEGDDRIPFEVNTIATQHLPMHGTLT